MKQKVAKKRVFLAGRYGPSFELVLAAVTDAAQKAATIIGGEIEVVRPDQLRIGAKRRRHNSRVDRRN